MKYKVLKDFCDGTFFGSKETHLRKVGDILDVNDKIRVIKLRVYGVIGNTEYAVAGYQRSQGKKGK